MKKESRYTLIILAYVIGFCIYMIGALALAANVGRHLASGSESIDTLAFFLASVVAFTPLFAGVIYFVVKETLSQEPE